MLRRWLIHSQVLLSLMLLPLVCAGKSEYLLSGILKEADGLSSNSVNCVLQDSRGYLWFGTQSGLDLWDGNAIETFHPGRGTPDYRVPLDGVLCLQDIDGTVWAGTETGLYVFDAESGVFTPSTQVTGYGVNIVSRVTSICTGDGDRVWIGTGGQGVFILNRATGEMVQHSRWTPFVDALVHGSDGRIWAIISGSLFCFSPSGDQCRQISSSSGLKCLMVKDGDIWIGGQEGLAILHPSDGSISSVPQVRGVVTALGTDYTGLVLAGTADGLWKVFSDGRSASRLRPVVDAAELQGPSVTGIKTDREGTLWVTTRASGILHVSVKQSGIDYIPLPDNPAHVRQIPIAEDADGNIFFASGKTLWSLSPVTGEVTACRDLSPGSEIASLKADRSALWVGTLGDGLYLYQPGSGVKRHYKLSEYIQAMHLRKDGSLILGTDKGVFSYYEKGDFFTTELDRRNINILLNGHLPDDISMTEFKTVTQSSVTAICEDTGNRLYIATSNRGVFRKNFGDGSWYHFISTDVAHSIPWNRITTLLSDRNGTVWAGTSGAGLWMLPGDEAIFTSFPLGYPKLDESEIYCMEQDADGIIWLSTSMGIFRLNPADGSVSAHLDNDAASAATGAFGTSSSLKASDGRLFFGYGHGVVSFFPHTEGTNKVKPAVFLRHFFADGHPMNVPPPSEPIRLDWKENNFTLVFAALSYTNPQKNLYSWRLKGLDRGWTAPSATNTVSYTSVPPGSYEFQIRGSNDDGLFSDAVTLLSVSVRPPWWRSPLAYLLYVLAFLLAAGSGFSLWQRKMRQRYTRLMQRQQEEREKELYKQRIRFFLGLVHEIRTPLTLLRLQSEKPDGGDTETVRRNLDYMQDTVNKILTFDKQTASGVEMLQTRINLCELVPAVLEGFARAAGEKGLRLQTGIADTPVQVMADEDMVRKILNNLLGNALKYAQHTIRVTVSSVGSKAVVEVSDDGPGVRKSQKEKIFGMFYTDPEDKIAAASGIGVGLAYARQLAEAHKGTLSVEDSVPHGASFVLQLPLLEEPAEAPAEIRPSEVNGTVSILAVEDNAELRETLRSELGTWYTVFTASDGRQALDVLERESIDVVVSDVMMPVMDGLELCRHIKGTLAYCHIPVILLTAKVSLDAKGEGMDSGADAYVEKPFSLRQLRGQIDNLIRLRQAYHEALSRGSAHPETLLRGADAGFIAAINNAIEKQLSEESFSIESLASEMAMSRTNFFRKFRSITGTTPGDYLKNYRLDRAAGMIREGARINEAAERTGFLSSSYFAKCFKAKFGVLPKDYLKG